MKYVYPVLFKEASEGGFTAFVPDLQINTQGESFAEAITMARDAICLTCMDLEDDKKEIPSPSSNIKASADEIVSFVDADITAYRRAVETRTIRRNVSLPSWLDVAAREADINVSAILVNALKAELRITDR